MVRVCHVGFACLVFEELVIDFLLDHICVLVLVMFCDVLRRFEVLSAFVALVLFALLYLNCLA